MNYNIDKIKTNVTWDMTQTVGTVEITVQIEKEKQEENRPGLYLKDANDDKMPVLCASLIDREGKEIDRIFPLPIEGEMQFCMCVEEPKLWNAEDPYCYQLILEIMEGEEYCQDRRVEPVAFWIWKITGGQTCMNNKAISFRPAVLPDGINAPDDQKIFLQKMKKSFLNTLLVKPEEKSGQLVKMCLEYGIYLLEDGNDVDASWLRARMERKKEEDINPDFHLQVVQTGVLIENKNTFVDAAEYELCCEIQDKSGKTIFENKLCTEVPAGTSKYVDIPFETPAEPETYRYRVALCLKKDTPWAPKGYEIAFGETLISNLYERI